LNDDVVNGILPDLFSTKPNLDRRGSKPDTQNIPANETHEVIPLKDRDWRGQDGNYWWECQWEGMDGIGGTNKKGKRCFDRVRIWFTIDDE
jgi:hypothetical protein